MDKQAIILDVVIWLLTTTRLGIAIVLNDLGRTTNIILFNIALVFISCLLCLMRIYNVYKEIKILESEDGPKFIITIEKYQYTNALTLMHLMLEWISFFVLATGLYVTLSNTAIIVLTIVLTGILCIDLLKMFTMILPPPRIIRENNNNV